MNLKLSSEYVNRFFYSLRIESFLAAPSIDCFRIFFFEFIAVLSSINVQTHPVIKCFLNNISFAVCLHLFSYVDIKNCLKYQVSSCSALYFISFCINSTFHKINRFSLNLGQSFLTCLTSNMDGPAQRLCSQPWEGSAGASRPLPPYFIKCLTHLTLLGNLSIFLLHFFNIIQHFFSSFFLGKHHYNRWNLCFNLTMPM